MVVIRYFAWLKSATGCAAEERELPDHLHTIQDLADWLRTQGEGYEKAFANMKVLRAARDHEYVSLDSAIGDAGEIAFFPPVSGG